MGIWMLNPFQWCSGIPEEGKLPVNPLSVDVKNEEEDEEPSKYQDLNKIELRQECIC